MLTPNGPSLKEVIQMVIQVREVTVAQAKAQLSSLLDAVEAGEKVVITRRGRPAEDWVARLRRFHAHQPGPVGSAVELLRELRDQGP